VSAGVVHQLAQFNIARLAHPLDAPESAEFVAALEPVNAIAESTPGFVWRLKDDDGASSSYVTIPEIDDPLMIVNYSIWTDVEALKHFVTKSAHVAYLRRRREWFEPSGDATTVCWWIPAGTVPPVAEGFARLMDMRSNGPSTDGWPLSSPMPRP
jgi:hypothetical protein